MNLADILQELAELGVNNPRLSSNYRAWVNRSQRAIAQRRNWNVCHDVQQVTLLAGNNSVSLGPTFKQLAPERSPISYVSPTGGSPIPVQVISRAVASRYRSFWSFPFYAVTQPYLPPRYVFVEQDANGPWTMYLPPEIIVQADTTFNVEAYYYPADLVNGNDSNGITTHGALSDALINRAKSMAYYAIDPTDPKGQAAEQLSEKYIMQAAYEDTAQRSGGRAIHM